MSAISVSGGRRSSLKFSWNVALSSQDPSDAYRGRRIGGDFFHISSVLNGPACPHMEAQPPSHCSIAITDSAAPACSIATARLQVFTRPDPELVAFANECLLYSRKHESPLNEEAGMPCRAKRRTIYQLCSAFFAAALIYPLACLADDKKDEKPPTAQEAKAFWKDMDDEGNGGQQGKHASSVMSDDDLKEKDKYQNEYIKARRNIMVEGITPCLIMGKIGKRWRSSQRRCVEKRHRIPFEASAGNHERSFS